MLAPTGSAGSSTPGVLPPPGSQPAAEEVIDPGTELDDGVVAPMPVDEAISPTPDWRDLAYWFGPDPIDVRLELGLNGSEGNNETLSLRAGAYLKRKTDRWKTNTTIQYNKNTTNSVETQHNAKFDMRVDRVVSETRWTLFVIETLLYDEFQAFDLMMSLDSGVGYRIFDTEEVTLLSRLGAGANREFGGPEDRWMPQALFGLEYEHQLTKMQRLVAKIDYFPEWEDFRNYRVVSDFGWEIQLDKPENLSLKFSVVDRYDSTPNGAVPNNLDYAALLIWRL